MVWNKITVVAAMLLVVKKETRVDLFGGWKKDQTFLEILGSKIMNSRF